MNDVEQKSNLILKALAILGSVMLGLSGVFLFIQFRSVSTSTQMKQPTAKSQTQIAGTKTMTSEVTIVGTWLSDAFQNPLSLNSVQIKYVFENDGMFKIFFKNPTGTEEVLFRSGEYKIAKIAGVKEPVDVIELYKERNHGPDGTFLDMGPVDATGITGAYNLLELTSDRLCIHEPATLDLGALRPEQKTCMQRSAPSATTPIVAAPANDDAAWLNSKIVLTQVTQKTYAGGKITFVEDCNGRVEANGVPKCFGSARLRAKFNDGDFKVLGAIAAPSANDYVLFRLTLESPASFNSIHDNALLFDFKSYRIDEKQHANDSFTWLLDTRKLEMHKLEHIPMYSEMQWNYNSGTYMEYSCETGPECNTGNIWAYNPFTDRSIEVVHGFISREQVLAKHSLSNPIDYSFSILPQGVIRTSNVDVEEHFQATLNENEYSKNPSQYLDVEHDGKIATKKIKDIVFSVPSSFTINPSVDSSRATIVGTWNDGPLKNVFADDGTYQAYLSRGGYAPDFMSASGFYTYDPSSRVIVFKNFTNYTLSGGVSKEPVQSWEKHVSILGASALCFVEDGDKPCWTRR